MAGKTSPPRKSSSVTPRAARKKKGLTKPSRSTATKPATQAKGPAAGGRRPQAADDRSPAGLLAQAEADLTALLDSLNSHMATAVNAITELAVAQQGQHQPIIRSRPIDRATAMFQRLVAEVLDDKLAEVLPTLVALRSEMNQRARLVGSSASTESTPPTDGDFFERGTAMLDQVLNTLEVRSFEPRIGDPFDPLIHLAVGQTSRNDLAEGVLAEILQPGFRTARGKVIVPARVKVNRR
ncbi:MAG TPA: nucleotide exchange factor GrpE [Phycisphaerae bacterium]|nr:nucleotide exchange factor GrpE [Phycisphaerae bacterium]HRR86229.1 nucleotide exchange factor GrpE [Phycisphaerae bacterium]